MDKCASVSHLWPAAGVLSLGGTGSFAALRAAGKSLGYVLRTRHAEIFVRGTMLLPSAGIYLELRRFFFVGIISEDLIDPRDT